MVEEADVLAQPGVVEVGKGADQRVGGDDAAHHVVVKIALDEFTEWTFGEHLPDLGE
ncbi:Uncharacterised protein [Mycobacteroides abscessus subsp. abscessus]|nr:Uncharacterised protein [Mycobacteroides abscessus subsp. abscessus]